MNIHGTHVAKHEDESTDRSCPSILTGFGRGTNRGPRDNDVSFSFGCFIELYSLLLTFLMLSDAFRFISRVILTGPGLFEGTPPLCHRGCEWSAASLRTSADTQTGKPTGNVHGEI